MTKNTLHLLLFLTLLILTNSGDDGTKKNCICNNNGGDDGDDAGTGNTNYSENNGVEVTDNTNSNTNNNNNNDNMNGGDIDNGNENSNTNTNNNGGSVKPPINPPIKQTTTLSPYYYVTSYVWTWKQGNKEKEAIRQKKLKVNSINNKLNNNKKPFTIVTTLDPLQNMNNNNNIPNVDNTNTNTNNVDNNAGVDDDGPNGTDDDDDDDGCICNGNGNGATKKPLPICYDGWAAWDYCQHINDCPAGYFCDTQGGCCPEMPWRKSQINADKMSNTQHTLTDNIEIFYENHFISFVLLSIVCSLVIFASFFAIVYCMCIKSKKNNKENDKMSLMGNEINNEYNSNDVQLIDMDMNMNNTYQNE